MDDMSKRVAYLQMIQNTIDRMSASSAIYKGFTAALVAGLTALVISAVRWWVILLVGVPVICFASLDIYYLLLEKKYRILYDKVRNDEHVVDFDLNLECIENDLKDKKKELLVKTIKSPSIVSFYIPLSILFVVVVLVCRFMK